ncbi:MAG: hypothetical protein AAGD22_03755 [Verrucomicrobiota bacterium]
MSDLHFICPHCHGTLVIDEEGAGWEVDCPLCASPVVIPEEDQREEGVEYVETATQEYFVEGDVGSVEAPEPIVEAGAYGETLQYVDPQTGNTYEVAADQVPPGYELYVTEDGIPYLQEVYDPGVAVTEVPAELTPPDVERRIALPTPRGDSEQPYRGSRRGRDSSRGERGGGEAGGGLPNGVGALRSDWELYRCGECSGVFRLKRGNRGAVVMCPDCELAIDTAKGRGGGAEASARWGRASRSLAATTVDGSRLRRSAGVRGRKAGEGSGDRFSRPLEGDRERVPFQKKKFDENAFQFKKPEEALPAKRVRVKAGAGTLAKAEEDYRQKRELPWEAQGRDVEREGGEKKGRGLVYASVFAMLVIGGGVGWMWYSSQRAGVGESVWSVEAVGGGAGEGGGGLRAAGREVSGKQQEEFYGFVNDTRDDALAVLTAFLTAPTHEERLKYVANPGRVRQLSSRSSRFMSDEPFSYRGIDGSTVSVVKGRASIIVNLELHDYTTKRVALHYLPEGWRVDWEWFVEYNDTSWVDFTSRKPPEALTFRVQAERDNYFNFGFSDAGRWDSYKLVSGDGEYQLYGYVDKASPAGQRMREAFVKTPAGLGKRAAMYSRIRCVLELRYPDAGGQANQVEIVDFVRDDWYGLLEKGG